MSALRAVAIFALLIATAAAADNDEIKRGRTLFVRACAGCHGTDGKALMDAGGDATDLTDPKLYRHGASDKEIVSSIRDGRNGMPAFKSELKDAEIQDILNFIHSLWK